LRSLSNVFPSLKKIKNEMECDDYSLREGAPGADFTIEELAAWKMKEKSFFEEPEDIFWFFWL
jgi:hypothetical protein